MAKKEKEYPVINYTSRDFSSIKNDLVEHAKRYYPDTFKDFSQASFGSLMMDSVAYIGDVLSFYLDYQANESFLTNAVQYENVMKLARQMGYKYEGTASSSGRATFFILCPANNNGIGPDTKYLPRVMRGTMLRSTGGATFVLVDDVDFSDPDNEVVVASADANNTPTYYAVKAHGLIASGRLTQETISLGAFEKFRNITLDTRDISEIISVTDSQGHSYIEVENLSQNVVYTSVRNEKSDKLRAPYVMVPLVVPRRFVVEKIGSVTSLQFGHGSDSEIRTNPIADPSDVVMDMHGRDYIVDKGFDPKRLTSTDKFGIAPANTTLIIIARINDADSTNAASNTVTEISSPIISFPDRDQLSDSAVATVRASLEVVNESPIVGDVSLPLVSELKHRVKAHFAAQNRAVTVEDYKSLMYSMPPRFGKVKRCAILQDPDSFRRNLNVYVVSQAPNMSLIETPSTIKENLKTWIGGYKMMNDTIDVLDARIVNIGVEFKVKAMPASAGSKHTLLRRCVDILRSEIFFRKFEIGEPLEISDIYRILNNIRGVMDTIDVKIKNLSGGKYSDVPLDIPRYMSDDGTRLYVPEDYILEVKDTVTDITGVVE